MKNIPHAYLKEDDVIYHKDYKKLLIDNNLFFLDDVFAFKGGDTFRKNSVRDVVRIDIPDSNGIKSFHLKRHTLKKIAFYKSIFSCSPFEDGSNEWKMMHQLKLIGIENMMPVSYGMNKENQIRNFTITEHLYNCVRLEDYFKEKMFKSLNEKRLIIKSLAEIIARFHNAGFFHNDLYLGHFFINKEDKKIHMIDLQRVQKRKFFSILKRIKDLSQLLYSAFVCENITKTDCYYFYNNYVQNKKYFLSVFIKKIIIKKAESIDRRMQKIYKKNQDKI